jgi:hypothetical protein
MATHGLGSFSAVDGEVYRNGIYLGNHTAERLLAAYQADPNAWAQKQARKLKAALREAQQHSIPEAA